jgi:membrane protease YdiL (CAAX protease family)
MNEAVRASSRNDMAQIEKCPGTPVLALCEFAVVTLIFWADIHHHIFLSKTIYLLPVAWLSLRIHGLRWRDVGLVRYENWRTTLLLGGLWGVVIELFELFVSQPLLMRWTGRAPDLELFRTLHWNLKWTMIAMVGAWTLAAFGEEMVYRGYLMNRVAGVLRSTRAAWLFSLALVSLVFGASHLDQGITGQLENFLDGLLLGAIYLAYGRSLAVPIIAHGVTDTIDLLLMFTGLYPTLR